MARVLERASRKESTARVTRKAWAKERKAKAKERARRRNLHPIRVSLVIEGRVASGDPERTSVQGVEEAPSCLEFNTAECKCRDDGGCEDGSCHLRG